MGTPYAFVTLLTSDSYLPGALTLAAALKDVHPSPAPPPEVDFQTVCLVTPETVDISSIKLLRKAFDLVVGVEIIEENNERGLQLLGRPDLSTVLTKLHIFRLTQFSKIIFLDADVLPIRPLSHLFTLPHEFSAVPDVGWPDIFNSGFMVLSPGEDKFTELKALSETKGSWDGADQGLLNEWRGSNWNRLSFTYNTTPTAVYTYAPAYERFGSQISAIHFIGANKPWSSIPWRAPGSTTAQQATSQPLQVYDYGSLIDRWYAVYDKYYRSQPVIPQDAYASTRYEAAWDQGSSVTAAGGPAAPATSLLSLEDLRRIAIEGFSGVSSASRTSAATTGEGKYISLPLGGRLDLMRPRPGPEKDRESGASADDPRAPGASAQLTFDDSAGSPTPNVRFSSFSASDLPRDHLTSDPGIYELPSALHFGPEPGDMLSSTPGFPLEMRGQLAAPARWQIQADPTSSLSQEQARGNYSTGPSHQLPQGYPGISSGSGPGLLQGSRDRQVRDVRGPFTRQLGQIEGVPPVGIYPQSTADYVQEQRRFIQPLDREPMSTSLTPRPPAHSNTEQLPGSPRQRRLPQELAHQVTQGLLQPYQARDSQLLYVQGEGQIPQLGAQQVHPEQDFFLRRDLESTHQHGQKQAPPQGSVRSPSPPLVTWNPASPSQYRSDSSPTQSITSTHFTIPPPPRIPERLLQEKHYVNVLGERQQGETPSPDRAKIKPVFPWEDKPRLTPGRVFPSTDSPPPGQFVLPASASPSPPLRFSPTQPYMSSPPSGFPPSFSYSNAWDTVPSIQKYASRLVRPPQNVPPLAPARESALFRNWHESGESSRQRPRSGSSATASQPYYSGKGRKKEYRSQGVQTIPKETRDQSVQVTILTDPVDANRSIKDKERPPRSRETSFSGHSPALAAKQREFPPSLVAVPGSQDPVMTSFTSDIPKLSPLGSPTGLRSPRYASPRGSSTNLAESTPRPVLYKSTQRPSTPQRGGELQRLPTASISRTLSSDTASSPSSAGPPVSPEDARPARRMGGRVWDPARRVEVFKRGSEEVLSRFLRMGSWEEEKQSQSPT
ncbi:hypothetical protein BC826DRAFT_1006072 [Russula brevipes]|nr:hypothetical protein BC826DRAFT_1006072 [Russula brevipes]